jgi:enoyl-CoA hydratase/carnithine racemase
MVTSFDTLLYSESEGVAWITLNRPEVLNAFNVKLQLEIQSCWQALRSNEDVRVVVLTGAGERSFCTGVDRSEAHASANYEANAGAGPPGDSPFMYNDVGRRLGPKANDYWKPVIAAVNGIAGGGAFYLLGESDIVIGADHATFFDPHVSYGMTAAFEPIELAHRMPFGELSRMLLLGVNERISAQRAYEIGLISEIVPADDLMERANWIAQRIAAVPTLAVQGTVRAVWAAYEQSRAHAMSMAHMFLALGNRREDILGGQNEFAKSERPTPRIR